MMRPVYFLPLTLILAAGCAQFPEVDEATAPTMSDIEYPKLLPVEQILDQDAPRLDENSETSLQGRSSRLKRRASELRNAPVE